MNSLSSSDDLKETEIKNIKKLIGDYYASEKLKDAVLEL